jgi:hypothetical protein
MTRDEVLRQEIEKYKKRISTYQAMIAEWEGELGVKSEATPEGQQVDPAVKKKPVSSGDPLSLISGMIFFNKSQVEAAKTFLEMVGYPLKTQLLLEAVEKGGLTIGGKTAATKKQNFYTILYRSSDIGLAAKDTWGLMSWPGVTKKAADDAKPEDSAKTNGDPKKATAAEEQNPS